MANSNSINFFLLNIRSLRHKLTEFQLLIQELEIKIGSKFDVLALVETWLRTDEAPMFQIEGYNLVLQERPNIRGGGVAMYVRHGLFFQSTEVLSSTHNALKFQIQNPVGCKFSGLLIYKFPKSNRELFMSELLHNATTLGNNSVIMGDINIDLLKHDDSSSYRNLLESLGFESKNLNPTREVANASTCIDHVYYRSGSSTNGASITDCQVIPIGLSDHHALIFSLNSPVRQSALRSANTKKFKKVTDWETLNSALLAEDWDAALSGENVNVVYSSFLAKLKMHVSNNTKSIKKSTSRHKRNPWASPLLVRLSKQKNDLYILVKKYSDNIYLKSQYKKMSRKVQALAINDKRKYFGGLLESSVNNPRRYWQIIRGITGGQKTSFERVTVDSVTYQVQGNEEKIANLFNDYFIGITRSLASENAVTSTMHTYNTSVKPPSTYSPSNSLFMHPVTSAEILDAIRLVSNKKSVGYDMISVDILKNCAYSLLKPLEKIF